MDRMTFGRNTLNAHRPKVDRFVAPRESFPELRRRVLWTSCRQRADDIWLTRYLQQKKYMNYLDEAFGLEPLKTRDPKDAESESLQSWPCIPRKKSYLSSADSILDLPTYSYAPFPELLDWSGDNILVAALDRNYHKWSWRTQSLISQGITQSDIYCCKFDPRGELLLVGTDMKTVEIHDNAQSKWITNAYCRCAASAQLPFCAITAIDWSPTGNSFVTGCSRGMVCSITRHSQVLSSRWVMRGAILAVKVSPDTRFVAVAAVNGDAVIVLTWPDLELYSRLKSDWTLKSLAWHPWRSALLGAGCGGGSGGARARLALWDAPTGALRDCTLGNALYSLDAMLFSHSTGELVLSLWDTNETLSSPKPCSRLVVMSDPDTIVDQWGEGRAGLDRVRTMVFSPDGTKLATATAEEDLIIWNFLPNDNIKKKKNYKRFSAMPMYLDEASYGMSLR